MTQSNIDITVFRTLELFPQIQHFFQVMNNIYIHVILVFSSFESDQPPVSRDRLSREMNTSLQCFPLDVKKMSKGGIYARRQGEGALIGLQITSFKT